MAELDNQKKVYLFLHGRMDLKEKAMNALATKGFTENNVGHGSSKQSWRGWRIHGNVMDATKSRSYQNSTNY